MTRPDCSCGFPSVGAGVSTFSPEWYRAHRDHHLAAFPETDEQTRHNLEMFVRLAEAVAA